MVRPSSFVLRRCVRLLQWPNVHVKVSEHTLTYFYEATMKDASSLRTFLTIMLVISGLMAVLAIFNPVIVELGFYFLVLPGFVLMFAPTVFMVLAVFTLVWWITSKRKVGKAAVIIGLGSVLAVVTLPPAMASYQAKSALAAARRDSIMPPGPVDLRGNIWLKLPAESDFAEPKGCSGVCMDLLHRPEVTALTEELVDANGASKTTRYRLLTDAATCQTAKDDKRVQLLKPTKMTAYVAEGENDEIYQSRKTEFDNGTACLIREAVQPDVRDHLIELAGSQITLPDVSWSLWSQSKVGSETLTIRDTGGKVEFFAGSWNKWSLAMPLRTVYKRNNGKPALGWDIIPHSVGETDYSTHSLLYIAVFGKPPPVASDHKAARPNAVTTQP
jgi:hypothetical protein